MEITIILANRQQCRRELYVLEQRRKHSKSGFVFLIVKIHEKQKAGKDGIYSGNIGVKKEIFRSKTI